LEYKLAGHNKKYSLYNEKTDPKQFLCMCTIRLDGVVSQ